MIELRDVHKSLGGNEVLRGVSLRAPTARRTFVIGASGAGKSVLARHAAGLLRPDAGEVHVLGRRIDALPERALQREVRRRVPFVLQGAALLDGLSLGENVELALRAEGGPARARRGRARELLDRVGLADQASLAAHEAGPGVAMRCAIARALALSPAQVIYDEPTSGLDPSAARQVDALLLELSRAGVGALVISHDPLSIFGAAESVVYLSAGRVAFEGSPAELRSCPDPAVQQFVQGRADGPIPDW
jgi:phospholipid/cholesterol/gamma-HCH transport system ATP-binding protein